MMLFEIITRLEDFPQDAIIYTSIGDGGAWSKQTEAVVVAPPAVGEDWDGDPPAGTKYFLEVDLSLEVIDAYRDHWKNPTPTDDQKFKAVLYYAENDTFLPPSE